MAERELWIGVVHFKPLQTGDWSGFDDGERIDSAGGYANVITWASSAQEFRSNADTLAANCKLYVVDIEGEEPLSRRDRTALDEGLQEIAQRAETNPNAIIFGTFHMYPHEDA